MSRERGNASVEFIGVAAMLIVPLVYLVLGAAAVQAGSLGAANAAREAGRAFVTAPDDAAGRQRAEFATALALADQGLVGQRAEGALRLTCDHDPCLTPGGHVAATVRVTVPLPLLAGTSFDRSGIAIETRHLATVAEFREIRQAAP